MVTKKEEEVGRMEKAAKLSITLDRDIFTRRLIRELAGVLQDRIAAEEASGYISLVGMEMGKEIESAYKEAWGVQMLNSVQVVDVLVDLKKRILGDFYVIEQTSEKIVLANRQCPFQDDVKGRPSLCMMTSAVFGGITARNLGYAKVCVQS